MIGGAHGETCAPRVWKDPGPGSVSQKPGLGPDSLKGDRKPQELGRAGGPPRRELCSVDRDLITRGSHPSSTCNQTKTVGKLCPPPSLSPLPVERTDDTCLRVVKVIT